MILVNRYNKQGNFRGWSSLSYTPIKAYCTAVLGGRDWLRSEAEGRMGIRYCTIGLFQIVMLISISASVWFEDRVSCVQRVWSVGVTDVSSLVVGADVLAVGRRGFLVLCAVGLVHRGINIRHGLGGCFSF